MYPSLYVSVSLAAACLEAVDKQREKWFVFLMAQEQKQSAGWSKESPYEDEANSSLMVQ